MLVVWLGWGQTWDTRHTWMMVTGESLRCWVTPTPQQTRTQHARKIEYKNLVQEIEVAAQADSTQQEAVELFSL